MIAMDTSVLVRLFVQDDNREQGEKAKRLASAASPDNPIFVSSVAIAETVWVLVQRLRYPQAVVNALLLSAMSSGDLVFEYEDVLIRHCRSQTASSADIGDALFSAAAERAVSPVTHAFDRHAARDVSGMKLLT